MESNNLPSRNIQRLAGLFIFLVSLFFNIWTWFTAFEKGYYYPKAALIFTVFAVMGLGIIIFPDYRTERINRGEDISSLSGIKLLTLRWWLILIAGFVAAFINLILLYIV